MDLSELPSVLQPVNSQQNSKENETDETGEGLITRSQSKAREEENE